LHTTTKAKKLVIYSLPIKIGEKVNGASEFCHCTKMGLNLTDETAFFPIPPRKAMNKTESAINKLMNANRVVANESPSWNTFEAMQEGAKFQSRLCDRVADALTDAATAEYASVRYLSREIEWEFDTYAEGQIREESN
jgi:hypothetical protein